MKSALSSLVVGERVVSCCEDGLLEAEYALFDAAEVLVASTDGLGVREQGYLTTAGFARERLNAAGVTAALASDAFSALRLRHLRALASTPAVLRVVEQLGPYEAFEGGIYSATSAMYAGAWLDLRALALACPLRGAAVLVQALHLVLVVEEVADDAPVRLLTANATAERRLGERTWRKVALGGATRLPSVLKAMRVPARSRPSVRADDAEVREELLRNLRARSAATPNAQPRLRSLAEMIARAHGAGSQPPKADVPRGTPAPPAPDAHTVDVSLSPDPLPLFEELRKHTELLRGEEHLRAVAQFLTAMTDRSASVPDLAVLASRAWLAAGEPGHARHFARVVIDNPAAPDDVRLTALEILESTSTTTELTIPPPPAEPIVPVPIVFVSSNEDRGAPPGASLPPYADAAELAPEPIFVPPQPPPPQSFVEVAMADDVDVSGAAEERGAAQASPRPPPQRSLQHGSASVAWSRGPRGPREERKFRVEVVAAEATPYAAKRAPRPEIVESLPLPRGTNEEMLAIGKVPTEPAQVRVAMTRMSRELGRDYRLWYGSTLKTDPVAIEAMQRHLRRRFSDAKGDEQNVRRLEAELTRHGALLSEILARSLGAEWIDISSELVGHWAMGIAPNLRVWPVGRIYRFFRQGHREGDLLAFYFDLEAHVRKAQS